MTKFTASEVRKNGDELFAHNAAITRAMLNAYADRLEANEKAVPLAWIDPTTINDAHPTCVKKLSFMSCADADAGIEYVPVYTHPAPADAERLAEALRQVQKAAANSPKSAIAASIVATCASALAAHSAQAQPLHPDVVKAQSIPFDPNDGRQTKPMRTQPPTTSVPTLGRFVVIERAVLNRMLTTRDFSGLMLAAQENPDD